MSDQNNEAGAISNEHSNSKIARENRGQRQSKPITVESYSNVLCSENDPKSFFPSRSSREVTPLDEASAVTHGPIEFPEELNFFSGNPHVEITNGIIHLYKKNERVEIGNGLSKTICLLAVPAALNCNSLLKFIAPCHSEIKHIRIIRDDSPNQFMVILEFRSNESAFGFYQTYNGVPYNSLESDSFCHAVWVSNVECGQNGTPPSNHTELPFCPVCLERMDESVDGVLTILCNHAFHAECLVNWGDSTCPVCRYIQTPELSEGSICMECEGTEALWICLICGYVGCGRYQGGHAASHFRTTNHSYALQLGTNRVWDYAGDNFVHRLLQSTSQGKLVATQTAGEEGEEKIDSMQLEFSHLLTSELEKQRLYYEERFLRLESVVGADTQKIVQKTSEGFLKEKNGLEKKLLQLTTKLNTITKELVEEKQLGKALQSNLSNWEQKYNTLDKVYKTIREQKDSEIIELKEQIRDLMFYMDTQNKIVNSDMNEELAAGSVIVEQPPPQPTHQTKGRRKKK